MNHKFQNIKNKLKVSQHVVGRYRIIFVKEKENRKISIKIEK